ncbi:unnamed protein product, partial [Mesorhabditis spiculigera]
MVSVLAYADDLAIVTKDPDDLHAVLKTVSEVSTWLGLVFNSKKCASLVINSNKHTTMPIEYKVQGSRMVTLDSNDHYEHLGVPTGYYQGSSADKTITKMHQCLDKIHSSLLAPWQKADAVNTFILPCIAFHLKNGHVEKKKHLIPFDKKLKKFAKSWMSLPSQASPEVVYLPHNMGGLGLIQTKTLADVMQLVHAVQLLESTDLGPMTAQLLRTAVQKKIKRAPTDSEVADYLNQKLDGAFETYYADTRNMWTRVRQATGHLVKTDKLDVKWTWNNDKIQLLVLGCGVTKKTCERMLKRAVHQAQLVHLTAKKSQGKVYNITAHQPVSNYFLRDGRYIRFADWRFVHRARLDVVPLNGCNRARDQKDKRCRRCGYQLESVAHVLCHCPAHAHAITLRHNAVLDRLVNAIKLPATTTKYVNVKIPGTDGQLRPDLALVDHVKKRVTIVDVTMPFENHDLSVFAAARAEKLRKYADIFNKFNADGYDTFLDAFIVGPLGGWDQENDNVLRRLAVSVKYAALMKKLMVADALKWSRDVYVEHITAHRQYQA